MSEPLNAQQAQVGGRDIKLPIFEPRATGIRGSAPRLVFCTHGKETGFPFYKKFPKLNSWGKINKFRNFMHNISRQFSHARLNNFILCNLGFQSFFSTANDIIFLTNLLPTSLCDFAISDSFTIGTPLNLIP
jgi:hypothetical protein